MNCIGKHHKAIASSQLFNQMAAARRRSLEAMVMDIWDPYIKAVQEKVSQVKIVFDLFAVVVQFSGMIDHVRNNENRKTSQENKGVFKGAEYPRFKNQSNIQRKKERQQ